MKIVFLCLFFLFFPLLVLSAPFSDDFDAYQIGQLHGQGGWYNTMPHFGTPAVVAQHDCYRNKCVHLHWSRTRKDGILSTVGRASFMSYIGGNNQPTFRQSFIVHSDKDPQWSIDIYGDDIITHCNVDGARVILDNVVITNEWIKVHIEWSWPALRISYNNGPWTNWLTCQGFGAKGVIGFSIGGGDKIDEILTGDQYVPPPHIPGWPDPPPGQDHGFFNFVKEYVEKLKRKFPFSWIYGTYDAWRQISQRVASGTPPEPIKLVWTLPSLPSLPQFSQKQFVLFDLQGVVAQFPHIVNIFRTLMNFVIWIFIVLYVFFAVRRFLSLWT